MQASNEDFRVTNEEVERSRQELRSVSEKLDFVKEELQRKVKFRKQIEAAFARDEAILESLNEALVIVDKDGQFRSMNASALKLHGFASPEEMWENISRYTEMFELSDKNGEPLAQEQWPFFLAIRGQEVKNYTVGLRRKDTGVLSWVSYNVSSVYDREMKPDLFVFLIRDVTHTKLLEENLREREARFRGTFENAAVGIAHVSTKGEWLDMNDRLCQITGYSREELLQLTFQDITHPDDLQLDLEQMNQMLRGEIDGYKMEKRYIRKDGEPVWVLLTGSAIREKGVIQYFISVIEDIIERKKAELALVKSMRRFELLSVTAEQLLRSSEPRDVIESLCGRVAEFLDCQFFFNFLSDRESGKLHLNTYLGITAEEASRIEWLEGEAAVCSLVARKGQSVVRGFIQCGKDPATELVRSYGVRAYACFPLVSDTEILGTLSFGTRNRDLFEQEELALMKAVSDQVSSAFVRMKGMEALKREKLMLKESEEKFRDLADNISQIAWMADGTGQIFWYNRRWYEFTGMAAGQNDEVWRRVLHPQHESRVYQKYISCIRSGEHWEDMFPLRRRDGEYRWFLSRASPIRDESGVIMRWFGTNTDITDQRNLEQQLRLRADELATINKELESFSYSVSHDLRAPLRAITGFSTFLEEDYGEKLDETGMGYIKRVKEGVYKMGALIDDLLNLSRISRQEFIIQEVDIGSMVKSALEELRVMEPGRQIEILIDENMLSTGDARLLQIALFNLVGNAWKFTSRSQNAKIEVGRIAGEAHGFFVKDNGAGFDMKYKDKLFSPFQRLHSEKEYSGTGIGLAIVERIIRRHGGRIWVHSEVGRGTTFFFTLPPSGTPVAF